METSMRSMASEPVHGRREFIARNVMIPLANARLAGDLHIPADAAGLVIFARGTGGSRNSSRDQFIAQALRNQHTGTLLVDLVTKREEGEDREYEHLRHNMLFLTHRLLQVTEWISRHSAARDLPLGYCGSGTGAAAALIAAAAQPSMRAVVTRGGRPDLAANALPNVKAMTLFIVGQYDKEAMRLNRQAFARLDCPKDFVVIPRASHRFEEPGALEDCAAVAARWFLSAWDEFAVTGSPDSGREWETHFG
jgi:dienelactone hydrolase